MAGQGSPWNSLEVAKLAASVLTPVAIAGLGILVSRDARRAEKAAARQSKRDEELAADRARQLEEAQWANRRAVERLIELHQEMARRLNDLFCFLRHVGHFREIDPPAAIARKRELDKVFYANEYLFSLAFRQAYAGFMDQCFAHWRSAGEDAKIKSSPRRLRAERGRSALVWDPDWDHLFTSDGDEVDRLEDQEAAYRLLMATFADELGLGHRSSQDFGVGPG